MRSSAMALRMAYDWMDTHGTVYPEGDDRREQQQIVFDVLKAAMQIEEGADLSVLKDAVDPVRFLVGTLAERGYHGSSRRVANLIASVDSVLERAG